MPFPKSLRDTPDAYGSVSRVLHWAAAYLLLWQFATLIGWRLIGDGAVMRTVSMFGPAHGTVGVLVLALLLPRILWSLRQWSRRPARDPGLPGRLAALVHAIFYVLMFFVPALALLRAYGSGKGYELWNLALVPATGVAIDELVRPADLLHAPLAWTLAALIGLHAAAVLFHVLVRRDSTLARMAGRWAPNRVVGIED